MENYRFYKENKRWYVDLPEWTGGQAALEMVLGADKMLEHFSKGGEEVVLHITKEPTPEYHELALIRSTEEEAGEGAMYMVTTYESEPVVMEVWLCGVIVFVFGEYPKEIFVKEIK